MVASTGPSAWRATLPLSRISLRPPQVVSLRAILNILFTFLGGRRSGAAGSRARPVTPSGARRARPAPPPPPPRPAAPPRAPPPQPLDQLLVARLLRPAQVVQQTTPLAD